MKRAMMLCLVGLLFSIQGVSAQSDAWTAVELVLDQAEAALDTGDVVGATTLLGAADLLLTDDMAANCPTLYSAKGVLQTAKTQTDLETVRSLIQGVRTLLATCLPADTADVTTGVEPTDSTETNPELVTATSNRAQPVLANGDWTPVIEQIDGVEMAFVPVGCFVMGSQDGTVDERPAHEVCIGTPYWIDVYEVTYLQYGAGGCADEAATLYAPVGCVTWVEAMAYCEARGGSLPSEAQWEFAARGPSNWVYPWGDDFVSDNVVYDRNSNGRPATVGSRPAGVSWVGAYDMVGNLWEWTSTIYDQGRFSYPYVATDGREHVDDTTALRVVRGGSFSFPGNFARGAQRFGDEPNTRYANDGFRCMIPVHVVFAVGS